MRSEYIHLQKFYELEEKLPIGRFLLAGLRFCGNWICVFDLLTVSKNSA